MDYIGTTLVNLLQQTAFCNLTYGNFLMIGVALVFLYLAIRKGFEPLLLVPIAFGMLLAVSYTHLFFYRKAGMCRCFGGAFSRKARMESDKYDWSGGYFPNLAA